MKLDVRTIMFVIIIGSLLMSAGLFSVARGYQGQVRGMTRWAVATICQAIGWIVVGVLRGVIPDVLSIVLGNALIELALAVYLLILGEFCHRPVRPALAYGVVIAVSSLMFYFSAIVPDLQARNVAISISGAIFTLMSTQVLLAGGKSRPHSHTFTASLFALCGVFMAFRSYYFAFLNPDMTFTSFSVSPINEVSYLVYYVFSAMLTFGFLLMSNERYIAQQKQTEENLQKSDHLLTKLSAQVPGAIYQFQLFPDGRMCFPFASQGIEHIYEVTAEQVREDAGPVFARIHPDDAAAINAAVQASARSMQPWIQEYRVILPQQGLRWRLGQAQPERLPDGSVLWHGFISDITDRALAQAKQTQLEGDVRAGYEALKASEQRLRRLMNSSLIGIVQGDASGLLSEANDVLLQMAGFPRQAIAEGAINWFDMTPPAALAQQMQAIRELALNEVISPFESQLQARDGSVIPVMLGLAQLEGSENEWVGFVLDLREQRRIDKLKSEFISVVSHELRTPLTSIKGSLGLLAGGIAGELPPKALQLVNIAYKNSARLAHLVNDILDMEKLASGKMAMHLQQVNLVGLAQQAIEANLSYAETFKVRYVLCEHPEQAYVTGDADRLMQVFANLLSNAAKFSPSGGQVDLRIIAQDQRYRVEVEDHGSGIPALFRERIFGKFAQADGTATRQLEGAGLGLNITKTLIEKMGGEIGFRSEENVATVFWFTLPAHQERS